MIPLLLGAVVVLVFVAGVALAWSRAYGELDTK